MEEVKKILEGTIIARDPNFSLEVSRNSRGYGWVIKVRNDDIEFVKEKVVELDNYCKEKFTE